MGVFRYASTYQYGISLLRAGNESVKENGRDLIIPDLKKLVTHHFKGLEYAKDAFEVAGKPVDQDGNLVLKVLIES